MSYEGRRNNSDFSGNEASPIDEKQVKKQQEQQASAKALKTAAKGAATYYAGPLGGKAVDALANTKAGQQILNKGGQALNRMPGMGKAAKQLNDSGVTDAVDKGIDMYGGKGGAGGTGGAAANAAGGAASSMGSGSTPSGGGEKSGLGALGGKSGGFGSSFGGDDTPPGEEADEESSTGGFKFSAKLTFKQKMILGLIVGGLVGILLITVVASAGSGSIGEYNDALGAATYSGGENGGIDFQPENKDAKAFYERLNDIKLDYQTRGKSVDTIKLVAVYHVLSVNNPDYNYKYMTKARLQEIANAMFQGNSYNEDLFKQNLTNKIFKKYFPTKSQADREQLTEDVFDYISRYFDLIGKDSTTCAATGTCIYDIKGFRIGGSGTYTKALQISNLMVRLMQCGGKYGNGNYTTPIDQDLVPFEDYVAGVAYAEVGTSFHIEAIKAQMVAARSFALARPTAMGNARGLKLEQENGQWILQISSCVADQVFCNINEGCTAMGGGDGQGGYVVSGHVPGGRNRGNPLPADSVIRVAAAETQGEVLVDANGYIISTGYTSTEQNKFNALAKQGYNYKQILMEIYNTGKRASGAADIQKMACNSGNNSACGMVSTGPFASWKQYEGPWIGVPMGNSGKTIKQIGCLATSVSILIAKSGLPTNIQGDFNPGTFVEFLNRNGGFVSGGNFVWGAATKACPGFIYQGQINIHSQSRQQKMNKIKEMLSAGYYVVAEVKGNTGQHWVAIDAVQGDTIIMMDPGSSSTDMWGQYNWRNTSTLAWYKV